MTDSTGRYTIDKPNLSAQDAYDIARRVASDPECRQKGLNLIGDKLDEISLLDHAAQHFGIRILRMELKGKLNRIPRRIKARKAKEWNAFMKNHKFDVAHDLIAHGFNFEKPIKNLKARKGSSATTKLDQLIGLNEVKKQIRDIGHLMKNSKDRQRAGLPAIAISQHLVFTGNPGTGKTTVARLVGDIYRELGLLKKGQFVEIDGRGLIAEYVGHTAIKAKEIISQALDGVLFIDEAYALAQSDSSNDFGSEAITTLIKMMEDHRDRLIVIIAGYGEEIEKLLDSNPGLKSRFKTKIHFPDYSATEIYEIFIKLCRDHSFALTPAALDKAKLLFTEMHKNKGEHFGNGRSVRNMFDRCILNHARRFASKHKPTKKELQTLYQADIPKLADVEW